MALKAILDSKRLFEQILLNESQEGGFTVSSKLNMDDIPNYSAVYTFGEPHRFEFQTCVSKTDKDTLSLSIRCFPEDLSDLTWSLVVKWKVSVINEMTRKSLDFDTITTTLTMPTSEKPDGQLCNDLLISLCEINDFITKNSILLQWNVKLSSKHNTLAPEQESSKSCDQQNIKEHIKATLSLAKNISEIFNTAQFRDKIDSLNCRSARLSIDADKANEGIDKILIGVQKETEDATQCIVNWKDDITHAQESVGTNRETSDSKQNTSVLMDKEDTTRDKDTDYEKHEKKATMSKRSAESIGKPPVIKREKLSRAELSKRSAESIGKPPVIKRQKLSRAELESPMRDAEFSDQHQRSKRQKISPGLLQALQIYVDEMRRISKETFEEEIGKFQKCLKDEICEFKEKISTEVKNYCQNLKDEMHALTTKLSAEKEKDLQYWVDQPMKNVEAENKRTHPANDGSPQPQSSFQREDGANILTGTIETQLFEKGGPNIEQRVCYCKKNPNHKQFIAVSEFSINHLPKGYYDNDLVEFIKATADLTVKVEAKVTSEKRPEYRQNTKGDNPADDMRRNITTRVGTGMLCDVENYTEGEIMAFKKGCCKCPKCQRSANNSKVWGVVRMILSTDVVFDEIEARHTKCRLFYDKPDSPVVTLDGWEVEEANPEKGWIALKCVTCDIDLLDKLDEIWKNWRYNLLDKVNIKYKSSRDTDKLAFIVSHPHGYRKKISVGHWIKKNEMGDGWVKYTYTTSTCPGSSGAYVHLIGYNCWDYRGRIVHSGVDFEGNNFSCAGVKFN
ncbi:unnamed protein product [Lymnaea stagnalis]|uniref:MATH domain-containing protein n=1 Tax=Lymnaea stagnalis TaxID=6523 RepID=A0AAV2HEJ9_LYMST